MDGLLTSMSQEVTMPLSWRTAIAAVTCAALLVGAFLLGPAASAGTRPTAPGSRVAPLAQTCQSQSILAGRHFSAVRIARVAKRTGFRGQGWVISVAVSLAESGGWTPSPAHQHRLQRRPRPVADQLPLAP
jgi:hypothetical protein